MQMVVAQRAAVRAPPFTTEQPLATSKDYEFDNPETRAAYKAAIKKGQNIKPYLNSASYTAGPSIGHDLLAGFGEGVCDDAPRFPQGTEYAAAWLLVPRMVSELGTAKPWTLFNGDGNYNRDLGRKIDHILYDRNLPPHVQQFLDQGFGDRRATYQNLLERL